MSFHHRQDSICLKQNTVVSLTECVNIGKSVEETYVIGRDGAECITGGACDIIVVD